MRILLTQAVPQLPEPPPAGWSGVTGQILSQAERRPDVFWPVVACALPLLLFGGMTFVFVRWVLPAWEKQKELDRQSMATALQKRGEEADRDAARDREAAKAQVDSVVQRLEGKLDNVVSEGRRSSDRIDRISESLAKVTAKIGLTSFGLVFASFFLGLWLGWEPAPPAGTRIVPHALQEWGECNPPCSPALRCCGRNRCCEPEPVDARRRAVELAACPEGGCQ